MGNRANCGFRATKKAVFILARRIQLITLAAVTGMLLTAGTANGTSIPIHPVSSGIVDEIALPFNDLNNTFFLGQNLQLDFSFSGTQFARIFSVTRDFEISLTLTTNSPGAPDFVIGTAFLSDQNGPLQSPQDLGGGSSSDGSVFVGFFPLSPGSGAPNRPFDFFNVRFDLILPNDPSVQITAAELKLFSFGSSGPFGVGPGIPTDLVPDAGSTLLLFSIAGLSLFGLRQIRPQV